MSKATELLELKLKDKDKRIKELESKRSIYIRACNAKTAEITALQAKVNRHEIALARIECLLIDTAAILAELK